VTIAHPIRKFLTFKENVAVTSNPQAIPEAQAGSGHNTQAAPVKRPVVLLAAIGVAVLAALVAIVDGVLMLTGGKELALDITAKAIAEVSGQSVDAVKASGDSLLDIGAAEITDSLNSRGGMALAFGALLLVFGLLMFGASMWSRVLVTLFGLLTAAIGLRIVTDDVTSTIDGLGGAALVLALIAVVLTWLPGTGRYNKARKQAQAAL
jgi:hypothetical protein